MLEFATSEPVAHRLSAAETEAASGEDVRRLTDTAGSWAHAGGSLIPHGTSAWRDANHARVPMWRRALTPLNDLPTT